MRKNKKEIWTNLYIWCTLSAVSGIFICLFILILFSVFLYNTTDMIKSFTVFSSGTPSSTRTVLLSIIFSAFSNSASKYEQFNAACKISVALSKSSNNCCGVFCVSASRLQIIQSLPYQFNYYSQQIQDNTLIDLLDYLLFYQYKLNKGLVPFPDNFDNIDIETIKLN